MTALDRVRCRLEAREWPTADEYTALLLEQGAEATEVRELGARYAASLPGLPSAQTGEQRLLQALRGLSLH